MGVQEKLAALLGGKYETWFRNAAFTEAGVAVETSFQADNVRQRFDFELREAFGFEPEITVQKKKPKTAEIVQLDFWEDGKRASANAVLRSALFPALGRQKRQFMKEVMLDSVGGVTVYFTGEQFDQSDFDVYLEILNLARPFPLGTPVKFTAHAMLKKLGKPTGGSQHKWLHSVLIRICGGVIDATDHKKRYFGHLIEGGIKDELMEMYEITINQKFAVLFGFGMWSKIDVVQRRALGGRGDTAKALHAYYSSHTSPQLHSFETLSKVTGLREKQKRDVRARLIKAHEELRNIGFLTDFEVTDSGIKIKKINTSSQQKHLVKAFSKPERKRTQKGTA